MTTEEDQPLDEIVLEAAFEPVVEPVPEPPKPKAKARAKATKRLKKDKDFATIHGAGPIRFMQDGNYFDINGEVLPEAKV